ncbi:protein FAR1-RELATED SEQUENCE 5-like [Lactuca sativa]|uniref:SWIM-type domain-containing protein n=1 Tax=Lactuca sativa TaxID=4236 RepID=A0A9R1XV74_LACSA|nr:protein FAR1-RELATED SEQUENCE 5-like [Lactuca sativa]KAJ0227106.1 hypothetical protein LSAT_V11C100040970 [Lactuca sativa]
MTNKFKIPFFPFTGVNHHGQSILFGGALLENEKEETFEWLFEHFLKCMFGKYPKTIIADQDKAMGNAIKKVFPKTQQRFCSWHIRKHENEHLRSYVSRYSDFQETHRQWVNSDSIEQFEAILEDMRIKYELESYCWISDMYYQRIHWAKPFLKDIFFAGMTTTGQSESISSFFDGFVNSRTMLNEFVVQYDKAVESRRVAEEDEDFKTMNSRPVLSSVRPIEAKAEESTYRVGQLDVDKKYWRIVTFHSLNQVSVTCSCCMYETNGILCKHSLYVMKKKHVQELPSHYILQRWTLEARYKLGSVSIGLGEINNENGVSAYTLFCVRSNFTKLIEQARDSPSEIQKLNTILISLLDDQVNRKKSMPLENASQSSCMRALQVDMMPQLSIWDPLGPTTTKGRQGLGHYATSSSKRKADESLQET